MAGALAAISCREEDGEATVWEAGTLVGHQPPWERRLSWVRHRCLGIEVTGTELLTNRVSLTSEHSFLTTYLQSSLSSPPKTLGYYDKALGTMSGPE